MSNSTPIETSPPARTHAEAAVLFRRPFAAGAIGFRAMTKVPFKGEAYSGAQVAAYVGAQSVVQRLNAVVPGRWRQQFRTAPPELVPAGTRRIYLACRLIVTLPVEAGGADVEAVYADLGEMDCGSLAGLKALYSDARKRAAVAAGIGAYLYTALEAVVLPVGPHARQVQVIRRQGYLDLETCTADLEQEVHRVVDYKVKGAAISNWHADRDPQAGLYLAARWLTGWPAQELYFAQSLKPGRQRKQLGVALTRTTRGVGQMRSSLARIAQAASQISVYNDRFGPDRPWGFADPSAWKQRPLLRCVEQLPRRRRAIETRRSRSHISTPASPYAPAELQRPLPQRPAGRRRALPDRGRPARPAG